MSGVWERPSFTETCWLFNGNMFINVRTTGNRNGEIHGKLKQFPFRGHHVSYHGKSWNQTRNNCSSFVSRLFCNLVHRCLTSSKVQARVGSGYEIGLNTLGSFFTMGTKRETLILTLGICEFISQKRKYVSRDARKPSIRL